ncbi:methyl-accepting chemotaxis protein [Kaarinaea lacus]
MKSFIEKFSFATIQQKLWGGFALVLVLLVIVVAKTLFSLADTREKVDTMAMEIQPTLIASMELKNKLKETTSSLGFFLLTKEEQHKSAYQNQLAELDGLLVQLKESPVATQNQTTLTTIQHIEQDLAQFKQYETRMIELTESIPANFSAVRFATESLNPLNREIFQAVANMMLSEDAEEYSEERRDLIRAITNFRYAWSNVTNNTRVFLTFGSQEILENVNLFLDDAKVQIETIKGYADILTFEEEEGIATLEALRDQWQQNFPQLAEIHRGDKARVDAHLLRTEIGPILQRIDTSLNTLVDSQHDAIETTNVDLVNQASSTTNTVSFLLVVGLLTGTLISWLITRAIAGPLKAAVRAMHDIAAGDGDLTQRLQQRGHDEISELAAEFNLFAENIQNIIGQVSQSAKHLIGSSEQMKQSTAVTGDTIRRQKQEMDQASTAVTQMSATSHEVAQNAELTADATKDANAQTQEGRQVVNQTLDSIQRLTDKTQQTAQAIEQLGTDINQISSVIDVIRGVAEQTNLLALNAAIEAARAGEQGRGFAVVADEVRTLANRTTQSTEEIQSKVEHLQKDASSAVVSMLENRDLAENTMQSAAKAGAALDSITSAVERIADMTTQIASAAEQQSAVAEEVNRSIVTINQMADENDKHAQSVSTNSTQLTDTAETLNSLVGRFKV